MQLCKINKAFPGVQALRGVDFELRRGEVHVLVGENGAGKSTLMKILAGAYIKDSGQIIIDGLEQRQWNPGISRANGVAMVYQEFTLVPFRSVAENIFLGREHLLFGLVLDKAKMYREASTQLSSMGIELDVQAPVMELGVGEPQTGHGAVDVFHSQAIDDHVGGGVVAHRNHEGGDVAKAQGHFPGRELLEHTAARRHVRFLERNRIVE